MFSIHFLKFKKYLKRNSKLKTLHPSICRLFILKGIFQKMTCNIFHLYNVLGVLYIYVLIRVKARNARTSDEILFLGLYSVVVVSLDVDQNTLHNVSYHVPLYTAIQCKRIVKYYIIYTQTHAL